MWSNLGKKIDDVTEKAQRAFVEGSRTIGEKVTKAAAEVAKGAAYTGGRLATGVVGAADDIWDYTAGGAYTLLGKEDKAKALFDNDLAAKTREAVEQIYEGQEKPVMEKIGNVAESVGRTLPYISAAVASTAFLPTVGASSLLSSNVLKGLGYAALGLSEAGAATRRAYKDTGDLTGREYAYGALKAGAETALEAGTNALLRDPIKKGTAANKNGYLASYYNPVPSTVTGEAGDAIMAFIESRMPDMVSEMVEGGVSAWLDPYIKRVTYDKNAEGATPFDIARAAAMDGFMALISRDSADIPTESATVGRMTADSSNAAKIIAGAKASAVSDYPIAERKNKALQKLEDSLTKTGGKVETDEQKKLLGDVQKYTAASYMIPALEDSAVEILSYPEAIAEKFGALGLTDEKGNPIKISVDDITDGVDLDGTDEEVIASVKKALTTNKTLATLAAANASARIMSPDAGRQTWSRYLSGASEGQMSELAKSFAADPSDYNAMKRGAKNYASTEHGKAKMREYSSIEAKAKSAPPNNLPVPSVIGAGLPDGVHRYGGSDGIAVVKENGVIRLYDYARGLVSKPLTTLQVNAALARGRNQKV